MAHKTLWLGCMILGVGLAGGARAGVTFTQGTIIASGDDVGGEHVRIEAYAEGQVDVAWYHTDGSTRYTHVSDNEIAVDAETGLPYTHHIMGISRDGGVVRVGFNSHKNVVEYTRTGAGAWTESDTGHDLDDYAFPSGGYDVDPCTGLGGFIFKDSNYDIVYVYETDPCGWDKMVLETNVPEAWWGKYDDLVYTPTGDAIGAYKYHYEDPNGDPNFTVDTLRVSAIDGAGPLNDVGFAFGWQHLDVTVVPNGAIYLLDATTSYYSYMYKSEDDGQNWIRLGTLGTGCFGDSRDVAVAVAPDESLAAVLSWARPADPNPALTTLWLSEPNETTGQPLGAEWYTDPCLLPGAGSLGIPDVAFDPEGNLFVAYYNSVADELQLLSTLPATCGDAWHQPPIGDLNADCYVDEGDLPVLTEQWLACTDPLGEGCIEYVSPPEIFYMPQCWEKDVDGHMIDWTDPCWVELDLVYFSYDEGFPNDIVSAKYTVCWDPCDDLFYAAVMIDDTQHVFESAPLNWDSSDRIEVYVQADPNGGDQWGNSTADKRYDKAQQYVVGYQGILPGWTWAVFGGGQYIPEDIEPGDADFIYEGGTRVSGDTITYEIGAKSWQWYGGRTVPAESVPNVIRPLEPGIQVGFDVVADSRRGPETYEFGMVSANLDTQKFIYADRFQRWELLDYDGSVVPPECGYWGYLPLDTDTDCVVGLADFAAWSIYWMDCTHPDPPCSYNP